jgi:hypothetical protein
MDFRLAGIIGIEKNWYFSSYTSILWRIVARLGDEPNASSLG